ncbi:hypothetical protein DFS33DRAFT_1484162 [Desarmillaria ectypa]|nr:hypothetical protein DFS33DRAFT_1484162 [Desarmillaria ectypa]
MSRRRKQLPYLSSSSTSRDAVNILSLCFAFIHGSPPNDQTPSDVLYLTVSHTGRLEEFTPYVPDGNNLLVCTATGDGKSSYFTIPILVHLVPRDYPELYAGFDTKTKLDGIVITLIIELASNIMRAPLV